MNNKTLKVFEYQELRKLREGGNKCSCLTKLEFDELLSMAHTLPKGMLEWRGSDAVKFKQFVGNIFLSNGTTIEILPKLNRVGAESDDSICRHTLLYMLANIFRLNINSSTVGGSELSSFSLQDLLIRHFCTLLEDELHKGYIRQYVTQEDNLNTLRGRLQINGHIRMNHSNQARFYCEYDEFSHDNIYNQQLSAAIALLQSRVSSAITERHLDDLAFAFADVTKTAINTHVIEQLPFNRMNQRYQPIFELLSLIIEGNSPNMSAGDYSAPAMLFDMNKLFEEFVANKITERLILKNSHLRVVTQGKDKKLGVNSFLLKPDIQILDGENVVAILDTKWKTLNKGVTDVSQADAYQMYAYAQRFGCSNIVLVYPYVSGEERVKVDSLLLDSAGDNKADLWSSFLSISVKPESIKEDEERFNESIGRLVHRLT